MACKVGVPALLGVAGFLKSFAAVDQSEPKASFEGFFVCWGDPVVPVEAGEREDELLFVADTEVK